MIVIYRFMVAISSSIIILIRNLYRRVILSKIIGHSQLFDVWSGKVLIGWLLLLTIRTQNPTVSTLWTCLNKKVKG